MGRMPGGNKVRVGDSTVLGTGEACRSSALDRFYKAYPVNCGIRRLERAIFHAVELHNSTGWQRK